MCQVRQTISHNALATLQISPTTMASQPVLSQPQSSQEKEDFYSQLYAESTDRVSEESDSTSHDEGDISTDVDGGPLKSLSRAKFKRKVDQRLRQSPRSRISKATVKRDRPHTVTVSRDTHEWNAEPRSSPGRSQPVTQRPTASDPKRPQTAPAAQASAEPTALGSPAHTLGSREAHPTAQAPALATPPQGLTDRVRRPKKTLFQGLVFCKCQSL